MWFRRPPDPRIDQELRYHFDRMVRDQIAAGLVPAEARRRARLEFGGVDQIHEEVRDVRGHWFADLAQDLRYAARTLRRSPAFLAVSVLSLALGIGANTAIFSLIDAIVLKPLPVPQPEGLVQPTRIDNNGDPLYSSLSQLEFVRDHMKSISVSAEMESSPGIVVDGVEENVPAELVSGGFFHVLGIHPAAGRLLEPSDDTPSPENPTAVISYAWWQRRFAGSPAVIGKTFQLEPVNRVVAIVGVLPPGFNGVRLDRPPSLILPLGMMITEPRWHSPKMSFLENVARLNPGVNVRQADAEFQVVWQAYKQQLAPQLPQESRSGFLNRRAAVIGMAHGFSALRNDYSAPLYVLMGIVGLVLLLACANLSGLLLARAAAREREISIRLAIGAGRGRLMRQFLTESLVLAAIGGAAGLLLAQRFSQALVNLLAANEDTVFVSTAPDWRVLVFTAAISTLACVLAGLAPGWHALRGNVNPGLKQSRPRPSAMGKALVVGQLAISMVLVVGAALFTATLVKLYRVDRGFRTDGVLSFRIGTNEKYSAARAMAGVGAIEDSLNRLPGVVSAGAIDVIQIGAGIYTHIIRIEGNTNGTDTREDVAFDSVGPKYFATVGTPLLVGRMFGQGDTALSAKVAVVNQSFARKYLRGESPIGRHVTMRDGVFEIVGMVADSKYGDLRHAAPSALYVPWRQDSPSADPRYNFLVRVGAGDPKRLIPLLDKLARQANAGFRIKGAQTYDALIGDTIVTERLMAALGGFFGVLALLVACLGVFGVMAYQVSRRTNEIGVRVALGAPRGDIASLVLREAAIMAAIGCTLGSAAALTLTGLTRKMLFGVTPKDPAMFALAALVLAIAVLVAAWLPARRAARIDPLIALRQD